MRQEGGTTGASARATPAWALRRPVAHLSERRFGLALTFVAGAVNAGGLMLVGHYTSHMSGYVSALADDLALGAFAAVLAGLAALLPFLGGAALSAMLINWGRRRGHASPYALPLRLEAALLLGFGLLGAAFQGAALVVVPAVPLLCFLMGLQNATITKISGARIRTTHVTGIVTDLGIELGKLAYWNRLGGPQDALFVRADRAKMRLLAGLLGGFFLGGLAGALGFGHLGFISCLPLAALLLWLAETRILPGS
ncbi:YoaK family protein [Pseudoroseomonas cervicalis]|uniref:YoaK family protein n=1 Tax=Teichococcus cervicalis TaxID=204525 RepID=UPI0022F18FFA|nr:YoaK family protein [Pseudoroseomonas cervicalis]WBV45090.1 YoaK family protein [Pseudoroseomonas cervicalis]